MSLNTIEKLSHETLDLAAKEIKDAFSWSAGRTVEKIGLYILENHNIHIDRPTIGKISKRLRDENLIQLPIFLQMKTMMTYRNYAVHTTGRADEFFEHAKTVFLDLLEWFYTDYLKDKATYLSLINRYMPAYGIKEPTATYVTNKSNEQDQIALLFNMMEKMSAEIQGLTKTVANIDENVKLTNKLLLGLKKDVKNIKSMALDTDEKILLIHEILDENLLDQREIERYTSLVKQWIDFDWNVLDDLSQQFLTAAEYLFAELSKVPSID